VTIQEEVSLAIAEAFGLPIERQTPEQITTAALRGRAACRKVAAWLRESASGPRYDACRECDGGQQWILDLADELDPPKPAAKDGTIPEYGDGFGRNGTALLGE